MNNTELYDRQSTLKLEIPDSVAIVGVGGVGSWVAFNLALVGVKKLSLYDFDNLELSNLNRTPYKVSQIGETKVSALTELIKERRSDCEVLPFVKKVELKSDFETEYDVLVDTRDKEPMEGSIMTGGYDGTNITLHFNPKPGTVWGDAPARYTVTPSYVVPPQLISNLITAYICGRKTLRGKVATEGIEGIHNFSVNKMLSEMIKPVKRPSGKCKVKKSKDITKKATLTREVVNLETGAISIEPIE